MIRRFAQHRVAANLLMVIMTVAGMWAVRSMPSQLDPPTVQPLVMIDVEWRGASAEDVETLVTTPIEQALRTLNELDELNSRTINGHVTIFVNFDHDADMTLGLDQVKQRVASIRNLPPDIEPPQIRRQIDLEPISALLLTGTGEIDELIPVARNLERELMDVGVEGVVYDGMPLEEIAVLVGGKRLRELGLTLEDLASEIGHVSQNVPAGTIGRGQGSKQLRSLDQRRDPLAFEQIEIESNDTLVRLRDVAEIVRRPQQGQPIVTHDGRPAIAMMLMRTTETDAYRSDQQVERWLATTRLPPGTTLTKLNDVWDLLGPQLEMILKNAMSGLALVVLILFVFLNGRVAWWVTVGIPVSFLLGLSAFHLVFGFGISIIALIGFVMAIGIVVDDAIVVGEDVVTHIEEGHSAAEAAALGATRMWVPVLTSSMTTLAAFIPLLIIGGVMGQVVLALPTVLLCVILASLAECFLVLPGHLRASLTGLKPPAPDSFRARFDARFFAFRDRRVMQVLKAALDYPGATVCAALGAFVIAVSLMASQHVGFNLITGFDIEAVEAHVEFSSSATGAEKVAFLGELETTLDHVNAANGGENLLGQLTKQNAARFDEEQMTGEQYASVEGAYAYEETRTVEPERFAADWRGRVQRPAFVERLVITASGGANNGQRDITLVLSGTDLEQLKQGAEEVAAILAAYPGVSNVTDNLPYGKEQIIFEITPRGRALGLSPDAIGRQLRAAYSGSRVQIFNDRDSEMEVRVMLPDDERDDLGSLQLFPIRTPAGTFEPLANVARLYNRRGIDLIRHTDSRMAVRVSADVDAEVNNAISITSDIRDHQLDGILDRYNLTFGLGGKSEQDQVMMETMTFGAVLTLILIYLILAWVFASYLWPLAIMMAIPFGFTGAVVGHWLTGWDVGAMSLLAFFALTGIVVNDSIVLLDFLKRDMEEGRELREALERAVRARFRAVILTSLTTIGGLLPLMFEDSTLSMYVTPIAITLCFGLTFATLLVLFVIPALILLLEGLRVRLAARFAPLPGSNDLITRFIRGVST